MPGFDGLEKMKKMMTSLRESPIEELAGIKVAERKDYIGGIEGLPPSNVLYYTMADGSVLVIRPSGTEPKVKLYVMVSDKNRELAEKKADTFAKAFTAITDKAV